ncbi:epimerase [Saccharopolyspora taberi]|uniref:SDR family oxidoreductase n=1 Tax=Saccharopolyspora taberi TaxID=60895 RepID=A0ABN3VLR1_9PSEU
MRLLVLGGTEFLSYAVADDAARRGHEVVCAARGVSGTVPAGARLVRVDREVGVEPLAGERFDAVVDVARMSYRWVRDALAAVRADHWTFVSTINVYKDTAVPGPELLEPITEETSDNSPEVYGGVKVASENAVLDALGDRALIVRPGLITGARDVHDRFGYWANRLSRGGRVVVPDVPAQPIQQIDVLDLAGWIVDSAERRTTGIFDAVGPVLQLGALLGEIAEAVAPEVRSDSVGPEVPSDSVGPEVPSDSVGPEGTALVGIAPEHLVEAGVAHWAGPKSLPLWAPDTHQGFVSRDGSAIVAAGLRTRPVAETARVALDTERGLGVDRERKAGLTAEEEAELLATLPHRIW